jgi:hypothetical protein
MPTHITVSGSLMSVTFIENIRTLNLTIAALGGAETFRAIQDVGRWWPWVRIAEGR